MELVNGGSTFDGCSTSENASNIQQRASGVVNSGKTPPPCRCCFSIACLIPAAPPTLFSSYACSSNVPEPSHSAAHSMQPSRSQPPASNCFDTASLFANTYSLSHISSRIADLLTAACSSKSERNGAPPLETRRHMFSASRTVAEPLHAAAHL